MVLKKRNGMVIEAWVYIVLAILSVTLLLYIFIGRAPGGFEKAFCKVFARINLFGSSNLNFEGCGRVEGGFDDIKIDALEKKEAIERLLGYVVVCWKDNGQRGTVTKDDTCYNVVFEKISEGIDSSIFCGSSSGPEDSIEYVLYNLEDGKYRDLIDNDNFDCNDATRGFSKKRNAIVKYIAARDGESARVEVN